MGNKQSKNIEYLNTFGNLTVNTWQKRNQKHFNKNCALGSPFFSYPTFGSPGNFQLDRRKTLYFETKTEDIYPKGLAHLENALLFVVY